MKKQIYLQEYCTPYQLKLPVDLERKIEIFDPVYTFCEVIDHIDLRKYLTEKDNRLGRKRYDEIALLKVILFAYMEQVLKEYLKLTGFVPNNAVSGKGKHKSEEQRYWERLENYLERLKRYAKCIKICGEERNS